MKLFSWATLASMALCAHSFELGESFRQPKNILFGSVGGGSTHINWVLHVLDELANRGHNITFVTHVSNTANQLKTRINMRDAGQ